jgi:hypothetical protein
VAREAQSNALRSLRENQNGSHYLVRFSTDSFCGLVVKIIAGRGEAMVDKTWAKWSYFFVNVYNSVVESISGPGVTVELASELAGRNMAEVSWWLGEQGWELVGCASPGPGWLVLIFKRLVSEQ